MPYILSVGTAVPPFQVDQEESMRMTRQLFGSAYSDIDRLLSVFANSSIRKRHFSVPPDWFQADHTVGEKNRLYVESACRLGTQAIQNCLNKLSLSAAEIDCLIFVSSTGLATPSIDARIVNLLDMKEHVTRIPIWGLGCAAGAMGVSRAFEYVRAFPETMVLLLAVELCGLTFVKNDLSKSNLVATSLFADGAAAVLIAGDACVDSLSLRPLAKIIDRISTTWKNSLDVMGWDVTDDGLKVIFSRDIPTLIRQRIRMNVERFLERTGMSLTDISRYIPHPGGPKVLAAYREVLGLQPDHTSLAEEVLAEFGNMSSATVLFVLEKSLEQQWTRGEYGLVTALGPGFSSELILLESGR
ncbi:type III polyketide synthase [Brevibacillus massiliensis]|jgi:alkylresorcinol/alkylpyrone synthase|uniref:type III polyketide synthase n=1 Tax=Brevibacillus massiliensis TaxID=1118054 RepID=UPI0002F6E500|nr:3-oxoacyl-[acyl-carrier-protein] synthase III C-terminal domain-containing protein [Brevibacillus massiliensis]